MVPTSEPPTPTNAATRRASCTVCSGPVHRPYFELSDGLLCSGCLESMSVGEMQRLVHRPELRGTFHF